MAHMGSLLMLEYLYNCLVVLMVIIGMVFMKSSVLQVLAYFGLNEESSSVTSR